jgi:hypothetical protein
VPVTVRVAVPRAAVGSPESVTVCCWPEERLNPEGMAVTPAGIPVIVTLACEANPFAPVRPTETVVEDPDVSETLVGCIVSVKSGGGLTTNAIEPA